MMHLLFHIPLKAASAMAPWKRKLHNFREEYWPFPQMYPKSPLAYETDYCILEKLEWKLERGTAQQLTCLRKLLVLSKS